MTEFFLLLAIVATVVWYRKASGLKEELTASKAVQEAALKKNQELETQVRTTYERLAEAKAEVESLKPFVQIRDTAAEAERIKQTALQVLAQTEEEAGRVKAAALQEADEIRKNANLDAKNKREKIDSLLSSAEKRAEEIVKEGTERAEAIAGDAYRALKDADKIKEIADAMRNVIDGYGDRYLKPTYSLLDELAEEYGFAEAGQQLKLARERSKQMIDTGKAAACDYVEKHRRETAIRFVIDAFNGKVDSILSRTKSDNYGTLEQQLRDAFSLVNNNGGAFRDARVTDEYLASRLAELKWATVTHQLREADREEQRRIREQIREEEKARREIERALKDAAKEEEVLQKAMEKVQAQVAKANDEQRAQFELKLADLQRQLQEAEERSQRALSMAQQTKAGHVYVISNVGSFGEEVFKVGMTRRLEPLDRVKELGDASVPFEFDVHAMIWSENAPELENSLHKAFVRSQVNKVNPRKEFFRLSLQALRNHIEGMGIQAAWTMHANAAQYRESLAIEERLRADPVAAEDWLRHQMVLDASEAVPMEENEDAMAPSTSEKIAV